MKIHFLGTAAAEGFPNVFCSCDACKKALQLGGKNIRSRSSVLIDEVLKVDYTADSHMQAVKEGVHLGKVEDLLITHTHSDHLYAGDLTSRMKGFSHGVDHPLTIYGNALALYLCKQYDLHTIDNGEQFKLKLVEAFKTYETRTAKITPLKADHDPDENCFIYFIERNGKNILYGNDTGWFPDDTWEWLKDRKIDAAILDCTVGETGNRYSPNHMSVETVKEVQKEFVRLGVLNKGARMIATHFSHNCGLLHEDLVQIFDSSQIEVAFDGMILEL